MTILLYQRRVVLLIASRKMLESSVSGSFDAFRSSTSTMERAWCRKLYGGASRSCMNGQSGICGRVFVPRFLVHQPLQKSFNTQNQSLLSQHENSYFFSSPFVWHAAGSRGVGEVPEVWCGMLWVYLHANVLRAWRLLSWDSSHGVAQPF